MDGLELTEGRGHGLVGVRAICAEQIVARPKRFELLTARFLAELKAKLHVSGTQACSKQLGPLSSTA
jgi:hypothetical protein